MYDPVTSGTAVDGPGVGDNARDGPAVCGMDGDG